MSDYLSSLVAAYDMSTINPVNLAPNTYGSNNGTGSGLDSTNIVQGVGGGKATRYNGSDEHTDFNSPFQSVFRGSFSIACFFRADDGQPAATERIFGSRDSVGDDSWVFAYIATTGHIVFGYNSEGNDATYTTSNSLANGANPYRFICCVADSSIAGNGGLKIYLDDELAPNNPSYPGDTSSVVFSEFTSESNMFVGAYNNDGSTISRFAGCIDSPMIFSSALTETQVKDVMHLTRTGRLL